ncbi:MAG TPA: hypothetical protein PLI33_03190 [Fervidobacterium sp.]|nr:hypothetical protein [Fervidobacterium sp.]HQQ17454.1 hypothetical protein [Fervidobacterium sp.]
MKNVSKGLRNVYWIFLFLLVVLTSCVSRPNNQSIILVEPKNAAVGVPFNGQTFVFKGIVGTEYELIVKKDSTGETVFQKSVVPDTETFSVRIDNGKLAPNTLYRWYVRVKGNDSKASELWKFTTKENSAPTVSNLKPNGTDGHPFGALSLIWDAQDPDGDNLNFYVTIKREGDSSPSTTIVATNTYVAKNLSQLTSYSWSIVAEDPWGAKSTEIFATFSTKANEKPQRVELLSPKDGATGVSFNKLEISWEGRDVDFEDLTYSVTLTSESTNNALLNGSTNTTYTVDLDPSTTYTINIKAFDTYGESLEKSFKFTTKDNTPPLKPSLTDPASGTNINFAKQSSYTFKWEPSTDPDGDSVYYTFVIIEPNGRLIPHGPIYENYYTIDDLKSELAVGKSYGWMVIANDPHGGKLPSDTFYFTTKSNMPPSIGNPYPANGAPGLANRIPKFSWTATDPDGDPLTYAIYIGDSPDRLTLAASNLTTPEYITNRLFDFSKTYYWKVIVSDGVNEPVESPLWSFTISDQNHAPTVPELVSPLNGQVDVSFKGAEFKWKASTDMESSQGDLAYYLYVGKADNMNLVATITGEGNPQISRTITNLDPLTTYYWRVEVKDGFGNYAYSTTWSFKTKKNLAPNTPKNPNPADGSSLSLGKITFSWYATDPDKDQLSYELYISNVGDFSSVLKQVTTTQSNYDWTPPSTGTYYWYVVAKDPYGGEAAGSTWTFSVE